MVIDCTRAATLIEALPRIAIDIGLALGNKVVATSDEEALVGDFTTSQQGWSTATTIEYEFVGTR